MEFLKNTYDASQLVNFVKIFILGPGLYNTILYFFIFDNLLEKSGKTSFLNCLRGNKFEN